MGGKNRILYYSFNGNRRSKRIVTGKHSPIYRPALAFLYDDVKDRYDKIVAAITDKEAKNVRLENFINELKDRDGIIQDFDNRLWGSMVKFVTVGRDKEITVTFRDGTEIRA